MRGGEFYLEEAADRKNGWENLLSGPVVKTSYFQCKEFGFDLGLGNVLCDVAKN